MGDDVIIEVRKLNKHFPGTHALQDVDLEIRRGEVHSVVGANGAGKSTLMNILGGEYQPSSGEVIVEGAPVTIGSPHEAIRLGIAVVYQELKLCENLPAYQNIYLGHELRNRRGGLDWSRMKDEAEAVLQRLQAGVDAGATVKNLTVGKKQLVEIARALKTDARVLILDEPTSSLSLQDTEKLFSIIASLKEQGVTIIFISHRMDEVFTISDRITALRDGVNLGTFVAKDVSRSEIVDVIAGKSLASELSSHHAVTSSEKVVLEVRGLARGRYFSDISFQLHEGEILGIYGLQGAGRTEIVETIFGLERSDAGAVFYNGEDISRASTASIIDRGIILVPEDRRGKGLFAKMTVSENINSALPEGSVRLGLVRAGDWTTTAARVVDQLRIKTSGLRQRMANLSGGNQQKAIIGKWLTKKPRVLLLDEVTRGIDVGAKAEIFKIIQRLRRDGISIILVSSEVSEILAECDRTLVMWDGRIVADIPREHMDKTRLVSHAMGVHERSST